MAIAQAWYVTCDDCGSPAGVDCVSWGSAVQLAETQGFRRARRAGRVVYLCAQHAASTTDALISLTGARREGGL